MSSAALIFPHQLFAQHPALAPGRRVVLVQDGLFFGGDRHFPLSFHKQKLVLHRASMLAYADELRAAGHAVELTDSYRQALPAGLTELHLAEPHDFLVERRLRRFAQARGIALRIHPSPAFLSPPEFLDEHIGRRKKPFMATFYQAQRKRMGILVDADGNPEGGQWSFDEENRKKLPKGHTPPAAPVAAGNRYVEEAIAWVEEKFPGNPGSTKDFRYPVTRADARAWLVEFIAARFTDFGAYEDAISTRHAFINHSVLTPALNIGLLTPREVVAAAMAARGRVPINSLEGFIRQVIGWREFMHGIYRHRGSAIRNPNFFEHTRPIPQSFYAGTTGIPPIDRIIRQLHDEAYCHHIERLMVLGNFMLLCRFDPAAVYRWFMEFFIDAYDWVMVPNIFGMSQFADGGTFTTKPYISGSNYVLKMSDERPGPWTETWDALFWTFVADHDALFLKNPRSSMMARTWHRFAAAKQDHLREVARLFLQGLDGDLSSR
jgi:deoxyribodipyrimidine photolyase-related protein